MGLVYGAKIAKDNVICYLDAANQKSYPGSGTLWYDLSGNSNHFTINSAAYNSSGKYMDFNGSYGCAKKTGSDMVVSSYNATVITWTRVLNSTANWRTLLRGLSTGADHQVIIQSGGWNIGMYDNINSTGFNSSGFSQQNLPGYGTSQWIMMTWRWNYTTSPYYNFSYNDTPNVIRGSITSTNARFKCGVCSIGAYNNGEQNTPTTASQYWGDISNIIFYDRYLTDDEVKAYFYASKERFGL